MLRWRNAVVSGRRNGSVTGHAVDASVAIATVRIQAANTGISVGLLVLHAFHSNRANLAVGDEDVQVAAGRYAWCHFERPGAVRGTTTSAIEPVAGVVTGGHTVGDAGVGSNASTLVGSDTASLIARAALVLGSAGVGDEVHGAAGGATSAADLLKELRWWWWWWHPGVNWHTRDHGATSQVRKTALHIPTNKLARALLGDRRGQCHRIWLSSHEGDDAEEESY